MAKQRKKVPAEATVTAELKYSKQQLLASRKYSHKQDLIGALLADGKIYSIAEVDKLIKDYNERKM